MAGMRILSWGALVACLILKGVLSQAGCKWGWTLDTRKMRCTKADGGSNIQWMQAKDRCVSYGGELITIEDEHDIGKLNLIEGRAYWIGAKEESVGEWKDVVGTPVTWFNWAPGEPKLSTELGCVVIDSTGGWREEVCPTVHHFICSAPTDIEYAGKGVSLTMTLSSTLEKRKELGHNTEDFRDCVVTCFVATDCITFYQDSTGCKYFKLDEAAPTLTIASGNLEVYNKAVIAK